MDGSNIDHSDSDSGESWTLLEDAPTYADDALDYCDIVPKQGNTAENIEKDEDTDGISVITDSEPESIPCEITDDMPKPENRPTDLPQFISVPFPDNKHDESIRSTDDLLGDNSRKFKTYVHRRNKRLSTVLNIIMLGSVITAAGVAIGHMWGVRDDCCMHTTPSVNKILSNLYKLQEENAYLRNKLKELTLLNNIKLQKTADKGLKPPRCKKMFEAPLNSENVDKLTKCLDEDNEKKLLDNTQPPYEKHYLRDVDKLKNVYMQNRSWLDEAIARRLKNEKQQVIKDKKSLRSVLVEEKLNQQKGEKNEGGFNINVIPEIEITVEEDVKPSQVKKITYADSLRSDNKTKNTSDRDNFEGEGMRTNYRKKRPKRSIVSQEKTLVEESEEEFKKDDRYMAPRPRQERKRDRHHPNKKQKRKNKYEKFEINNYINDDEFSVTSQENDFILKQDKNEHSRDFERSIYIDQFGEAKDTRSTQTDVKRKGKPLKGEKNDKPKEKDASWYEKRAMLRTEARKKLEHELFGDNNSNSGWYFKRMQKREQCRVKGDNSTHRKHEKSKRAMNFKTKR